MHVVPHFFMKRTRTKKSLRTRAPEVTLYRDTTTYHEGYLIFRGIDMTIVAVSAIGERRLIYRKGVGSKLMGHTN